jgi:lysozyme
MYKIMDNKTAEIAEELIKKFEGLELKAYYCSAGVRTIGWGHVIKASDNIGECITLEKAEELLEQDIANADSGLFRNTRAITLNHNQRAALISFIFNLGGGAFQSSTLRQKLIRNEYALAANEFKRWVYARGVKLRGLERRRIAEQELFETPIENEIIYPSVSILSKFRNYIFAHVQAQ